MTNSGVMTGYGGSAVCGAKVTYSVATALGTDTVTVATGSLDYNTSHVVGSSFLTASGLTVSGVSGSGFTSASLASDYGLRSATASRAASSAAITSKAVTATLTNTGVTKVYDGTGTSGEPPSFPTRRSSDLDTVTVATGSLDYNTSHVVGSSFLTASGLTVSGVSGSGFTSASL